MLESAIQKKIITHLEKQGWYVVKLIQTNKNGIPDLLCIKNGVAKFIEVKRPGESPSPLQLHRHKELREAGVEVVVWDEVENV